MYHTEIPFMYTQSSCGIPERGRTTGSRPCETSGTKDRSSEICIRHRRRLHLVIALEGCQARQNRGKHIRMVPVLILTGRATTTGRCGLSLLVWTAQVENHAHSCAIHGSLPDRNSAIVRAFREKGLWVVDLCRTARCLRLFGRALTRQTASSLATQDQTRALTRRVLLGSRIVCRGILSRLYQDACTLLGLARAPYPWNYRILPCEKMISPTLTLTPGRAVASHANLLRRCIQSPGNCRLDRLPALHHDSTGLSRRHALLQHLHHRIVGSRL